MILNNFQGVRGVEVIAFSVNVIRQIKLTKVCVNLKIIVNLGV